MFMRCVSVLLILMKLVLCMYVGVNEFVFPILPIYNTTALQFLPRNTPTSRLSYAIPRQPKVNVYLTVMMIIAPVMI